MSQNIVAICDVRLRAARRKLKPWQDRVYPPPAAPRSRRRTPGRSGRGRRTEPAARRADLARTSAQSKAQQAADAKWTREPQATRTLKRFVDEQLPRLQEVSRLPRDARRSRKTSTRVIVATPDHMHAVIASAAMDARQARVRAEADVLVGARSAASGEEGGRQSEARHADGQPGPFAGRGAARAGVSGGRRHRRHPRSARVDESSARATGRRAFRGRRRCRRTGDARAWNNSGVTRAARGGDESEQRIRCPTGSAWDLFLGVAPDVEYHPLYHPFNWRGWVDWGQGALGDMGAHLIDHPVWGLEARPADVDRDDRRRRSTASAIRTRRRPTTSSRRARACRR